MVRRDLALGLALSCGTLLAFVPHTAAGQDRSHVQYTRDRTATLVQKNVGDQQWTITYELESGHVTGNVRSADEAATFLDCRRIAVDDGLARFDCYVSDGCAESSCDPFSWAPFGEVEVSESFFLPDWPGWTSGCCELGGPCVDMGPSPNACLSVGGNFVPDARCEVLRPLPDCPEGIPAELCFEGACRALD